MTEPFDLSAWEPQYTSDPYPLVGKLRDTEPVSRVRVDGLAVWLVTGYDEVQQALLDPALRNDPAHAGPEAAATSWTGATRTEGIMRHMLRSDPPVHSRLRRLVSKAFTARRVSDLRPRVEQIAQSLISDFAGEDHIDLVERYAAPLPITVISELFGVTLADLDQFVYWAEIYAGIREGDTDKLPAAVAWLAGRLKELIAECRAAAERPHAEDEPGRGEGTLIEALIGARDAGDRLNEDELLAMAFLILVAGYETTVNLIASGTWLLLSDPERYAAISADRSLLGPAIEECLRMESPVKVSAAVRYATKDTTVGDVRVSAGDAVLFHFGAANRDPRRFADPDGFDWHRFDQRTLTDGQAGAHLAFSHGLHYCLGAPLARLEAEIALTALMDTFPDLRLAEPGSQLAWRTSRIVRGLTSLPVTLH